MNIAVVYAGCGYLDGAEINEVVGCLWALSAHKEAGVNVRCFAPDEDQFHVVDHLTGKEVPGERRNILHEAARIVRGKVKPLDQLDPAKFDALIMPGGFGAAKNLSSFAREGASGSVHPVLGKIIQEFHASEKPIGAACIAPANVALALKGKNLELTVGAEGGEAREIESLGHTHIVTSANEINVDQTNQVVTTPAYMYGNAPLYQIFDGIKKMVDSVVAMVNAEVAS